MFSTNLSLLEISMKSSKTSVKPPNKKNRPTLTVRLVMFSAKRLRKETDEDTSRKTTAKNMTKKP